MSSCEKKFNGYVNLKRTVGYQSTIIGEFACYILACLSSCLITEWLQLPHEATSSCHRVSVYCTVSCFAGSVFTSMPQPLSPDMFKLVQVGPHSTGTPDMFKLVHYVVRTVGKAGGWHSTEMLSCCSRKPICNIIICCFPLVINYSFHQITIFYLKRSYGIP